MGDPATLDNLELVFTNVVQVILVLGGIAFLITLMLGGFKYITAGGDPKGIEEAKKTLTFAVLGAVLLACAYLVLVLISNFTGNSNLLQFKIVQ